MDLHRNNKTRVLAVGTLVALTYAFTTPQHAMAQGRPGQGRVNPPPIVRHPNPGIGQRGNPIFGIGGDPGFGRGGNPGLGRGGNLPGNNPRPLPIIPPVKGRPQR